MKEELKNIEVIIIDFFNRAGFPAEIKHISLKAKEKEDEIPLLTVNVKTSEAQMLIGKQGLVLADIQLLLRKLIKKNVNQEIFLNLDIDNYKKNKENYLREIAEDTADKVSATGITKELALSSPFDRRVVHTELADRLDVKVESVGVGEDRKIVISPIIE
ncbi:MAG: R3H domain-containing nucleic acid-binding protein [Candidatus Paceibacterota bacterium]